MIRKYLSYFLSSIVLAGALSGCGSTGKTASDENGIQQPQILILSGTISYDSVKTVYDMTVTSRQLVDGVLNLEPAPISESDVKGLNYVQLGKKDRILSIHKMDNPLVQQIEYKNGETMGRMTVYLKEAVYYLRIQQDPSARKILFRNGNDEIMKLDIR